MGARIARYRLAWIILASTLWLLSFWAIAVRPIHGFADNGDFWRTMKPAGIAYLSTQPWYREVISKYAMGEAKFLEADTSAILPVALAKALASLSSDHFDLRILGVLHWLIALAGSVLLCYSLPRAGVFLFSWIFVDPNYFLHFNSFFSEAFFLCLFPWILWSINHSWKHPKLALATGFAIGTLAGLSKGQYMLVPFIAGVAVWFGLCRARKWIAGGYALAGLLVVILYNTGFMLPSIQRMTAYQTTFGGIAEVASDPAESMRIVGVPDFFFHLAGTNYLRDLEFVKTNPDMLNYLNNFSRFKLLYAYLMDPAAIWRSLGVLQDGLKFSRLGYLGNFEESARRPGQEYAWPFQFSNLPDFIFGFMPWLVWLAPLFGFYVCFVLIKKKSVYAPLLIFLLLHFWSQLPIAVLGDGFFSTSRHLISARLSNSFLLLSFLGLALKKRQK